MSSVGNYEDHLIHDNYQFFDDRVANNKGMFALNPDTAKAIENGGGFSDDAIPDGGSKTAGAFVARFAAENGPDLYHGEGVETVIYEEAFADFGPMYPELDLSGFANVVDIYGNGEGIDAMGVTQAMTDGVLEIDLSSSDHGGLVDIRLDKVPYRAFLANISLQMEGQMPASVEDFVDLMSELSGDTLIGEPRDKAVSLLTENFGPYLDRAEMKAVFEENFIAIDYRSADLPIVNLIWSDGGKVIFDDTPGELLEQEYGLAEEDKIYSNMEFAKEGQLIDKEGNSIPAWVDFKGSWGGGDGLSDEEQADQDAQAVIANFVDNGVGDGTTVPKTAFDDAPFAGGDVSSEEWKTVVRLFRTDVPEAITVEALGRAILGGIVEVNFAGEITDINLGKVTGDMLLMGLANRFDIELGNPFPIDGFLEGIAYITGDDSINTPENREFLIENYADYDGFQGDVPGISFESARDIFTDGTMVIDKASNDLDFISINFDVEAVSSDEEAP